MKLQVVFYSKDDSYISRLANFFSIHYHEKLEMSFFTEKEALFSWLVSEEADILLAEEELAEEVELRHLGLPVIYLVEKPRSEDKQNYIFKYQKGEMIYKRLLDILALHTGSSFGGFGGMDGEVEIDLFFSVNGGAGASTVSAAYALHSAQEKRVLYLNLEIFGNCEGIFSGTGEFTFDDVLYALKSRHGNLLLKLESCLRKTEDGVGFYAPTQNPMNLLEITKEDFERLLGGLKECGLFDRILIDADGFPSMLLKESMRAAHRIWIVSDGSQVSVLKMRQMENYLSFLDKKEKILVSQKCGVFYNRCNDENVKSGLKIIGMSTRYKETEPKTIVRKMAKQAFENTEL